MIIEKEFKENIHLHTLYFTLETFYQTAYPSYHDDIRKHVLKLLDILKAYIDHDYKNHELIKQEFFSKNIYDTNNF